MFVRPVAWVRKADFRDSYQNLVCLEASPPFSSFRYHQQRSLTMWPFSSTSSSSAPPAAASADKCPVDEETRLAWLKANPGKSSPFQPASQETVSQAGPSRYRDNNDESRLSKERVISSIPRSYSPLTHPTAAQAAQPPPTESESEEGRWVYPSARQFYNAMKRKQQNPNVADMDVVVPIHNAVNEQAWKQILQWEKMWTGKEESKLVSFKGRPKDLTWRAWFNTLAGYQRPFDRHDWTIERPGTKEQVRYVIDFYTGRSQQGRKEGGESLGEKFSAAGKGQGQGQKMSFYLDVRPAPSTVEGVGMRGMRLWRKWFGETGSAPQ